MIKLILGTLLLALGTDFFLYSSNDAGIGVTLFIMLFIAVFVLNTTKHKKIALSQSTWLLIGALLVGSLTFTLFHSVFATILASVGILYLASLFVFTRAGFSAVLPPEQYLEILLRFLDALPRSLGKLSNSLREATSDSARSVMKVGTQIIVGLLVFIPIGTLFFVLFRNADPLFAESSTRFLEWITSVDNFGNILEHIVIIPIFFLFWLLPLALISYTHEHPHKTVWDARTLDERTWTHVVFGGLITLFGLFIGFQAFYLFGGADAFDAIDLTYAEYAKQGFYQLLAVAGLVLGVASAYHMFAHKQQVIGRIMLSLLLIETFAILMSALVRLSLYVNTYGLTATRHAGYWGITLIGIALFLTIMFTWHERSRRLIPSIILVTFALGGIAYPYFTPDRMIAKHNLSIQSPYFIEHAEDLRSTVGADGIAFTLKNMRNQLPIDIQSEGSDPSRNWLCENSTYENYAHGVYWVHINGRQVSNHSSGLVRTREWIESLDDQKWNSWNLARARAVNTGIEMPPWFAIASPELFKVLCAD